MERVMVVPTVELGPRAFQGFLPREEARPIISVVRRSYTFAERSGVERDPTFKQIIPYVVFVRGEEVFVMRRKAAQSEERLHNLISLGVGGHVNPAPGSFEDILERNMLREVSEEVAVSGSWRGRLVGLINDDATPVGRHHLGFAYLARLTGTIEVREKEGMDGRFLPLSVVGELRVSMESWSRILLDSLLLG
mgnify:CR=1 FL=1